MVFPTQSGLNCGSAKRFAMEKKMKKGTVLNSDISSVISVWDIPIRWWYVMLVYPSPKDNAYRYGINPGCTFFYAGAGVVTNEMQVEAAIIAEEIKQQIRNSTKRCSLTLSSCKNTREYH